LTLAVALQQRGVPVQVFEQAWEFSEVGAGVALSGNSTRLLGRLGVAEELAAVSVEPSQLVIRRWEDSRIIAAHPMAQSYQDASGAPYWTLHRVDLQRVLTNRVDVDAVELGRRCIGVAEASDDVMLTSEDGSEAQADVAIGADGVRSEVRRLVLRAEAPVFSGTVGYRGLVPVWPSAVPPGPIPAAAVGRTRTSPRSLSDARGRGDQLPRGRAPAGMDG
jgi:2-polyprenyl-6-methoxyphenol hydroxylase-like FAD-dependent oxidoreductase